MNSTIESSYKEESKLFIRLTNRKKSSLLFNTLIYILFEINTLKRLALDLSKILTTTLYDKNSSSYYLKKLVLFVIFIVISLIIIFVKRNSIINTRR